LINNVVLVGRAGTNPEVKHFNSGAVVCEIRMAVNRQVKDEQVSDWFTVKIWGKPAEVAAKYIEKGHLFGITGELQEEKWEQDGQKRSKIIVAARTLKLMQPKNKDEQEQESSSESEDYDPFA
jgi:single-strand DNA-binding protein